jgi:glycosyltransferase involved in cell wall biosynthesis
MGKEKIIFLSSKNPFSKKDWSGIPYFLYQALINEYDVEYIPLTEFKRVRLFGYYVGRLFFFLLYAAVGSVRLRNKKAKFIFSPAGLTEIAFLRTSIPIVSYGDCSTLQLIDYYPALFNVCKLSRIEIEFVERLAIRRVHCTIFSSDWASNFIAKVYKASPITIAFGANLIVAKKAIPKEIRSNSCKLLFIGADWQRKGGDTVIKVHKELLERGINSQLTIVGMDIPENVIVPDHVTVINFMDKDTEVGVKNFTELFEKADFFILPTVADCTPIVIAEAYEFGLPVLATQTGGLSSMVFNDITGYLFQLDDCEGYISYIIELSEDKLKYRNISKNCLAYHNSIFNWNSWANKLHQTCDTKFGLHA